MERYALAGVRAIRRRSVQLAEGKTTPKTVPHFVDTIFELWAIIAGVSANAARRVNEIQQFRRIPDFQDGLFGQITDEIRLRQRHLFTENGMPIWRNSQGGPTCRTPRSFSPALLAKSSPREAWTTFLYILHILFDSVRDAHMQPLPATLQPE
jgi:hypothetical protein